MTATFTQARDQMLDLLNVAWLANTPAINGGVAPTIQWEGVAIDDADFPPRDGAWAKVFIRHQTGNQSTLSKGSGSTRFEKGGTLTVQVFAPLGEGEGLMKSQQLAEVGKNAFEGQATSRQVWFRDVRIEEIGVDGPWFQMNVVLTFEYDELR